MIAAVLQVTVIVIAILMVIDLCRQARWVTGIARLLRKERGTDYQTSDDELPKAAIILSLRGPDPCLQQTLRALAAQDYRDFHIHVVVDSDQDPVLNDVTRVQRECRSGLIQVSLLSHPSRSRSLKCSSLIQAVQSLDEDVEVVAFIDGDAVPHSTWLKNLVQPLLAGEGDVVGGNRWYIPPKARMGSMARYFWNGGFLTGMCAKAAPWAGTMAMRRETIDRIGLLDAWSTAMSVDATLHRCLTRHGLKFQLIGRLMMTNREDISVRNFFRWVSRQMAVIRYSNPDTVKSARSQIGILMMIHAVMPMAATLAFATGLHSLGFIATGLLFAYWLGTGAAMIGIERSVRATLHDRNEDPRWLTPLKLLLWYPALVLVHFITGASILRALKMKQVKWRGIRYRLRRNGTVAMSRYRPYLTKLAGTKNRSVI